MVLLHLRDLPFELDLGQRRRLRQVDLHAVPGRLDVADVHQSGERRGPEAARAGRRRYRARRWSPVRLSNQRGRHHPGVLAVEVALLRPGDRRLVPRMPLIDRIAERIVLDEDSRRPPSRRKTSCPSRDAHAEVDVDEIGRDELAIDDDAGRDVHLAAPVGSCSGRCNRKHRDPGTIPSSPAGRGAGRLPRSRAAPRRRKSNRSSCSGTTFFMNSTYFMSRRDNR